MCEDQGVRKNQVPEASLVNKYLATEASVVSNSVCGAGCGDIDSGSKEESSSFEAKPNIVEPAVQARSEELLLIQKSKSNPKFDLYAVPGGKFNLKWSKKEFSTKKSDILVGQSGSQKPSFRKFRGENIDESRMFNKIPILSTPTKRKIESDSNIVKLASIFGGTSASKPDQHIFSESPAKRRKWGQGGVKSMTSDN